MRGREQGSEREENQPRLINCETKRVENRRREVRKYECKRERMKRMNEDQKEQKLIREYERRTAKEEKRGGKQRAEEEVLKSINQSIKPIFHSRSSR